MQINDKSKLYLKFANPVTLEYQTEGLTGEYMFGADTDRDLQTACCVTATAAAVDGVLTFTPAMDNQTFFNKVQTNGKTAGFWEIWSVSDHRCIASGLVLFSAAVVIPSYTPAPEPKVEYYQKAEVDALIAAIDISGAQGEVGPQGPQGEPGAPGLANYFYFEIATDLMTETISLEIECANDPDFLTATSFGGADCELFNPVTGVWDDGTATIGAVYFGSTARMMRTSHNSCRYRYRNSSNTATKYQAALV